MLDPHVVISYMWNTVGPRIDPENVKTFWRHHREVGSPWTQVCTDAPDDLIHLGIYGDSARARQLPYTAPEKVVGIYMSCPLFRPKSVRQSRWLLFCIEEHLIYERKTLNAVFRRITWSLNILWYGLKPTRGPDNEELNQLPDVPITDGCHKLFLAEIRGDWSWHRFVFGLVSSWKAGANAPVCWKCPAYAVGPSCMHYYQVDEQSMGRFTEHSLVEFLLNEMPPTDVWASTDLVSFVRLIYNRGLPCETERR